MGIGKSGEKTGEDGARAQLSKARTSVDPPRITQMRPDREAGAHAQDDALFVSQEPNIAFDLGPRPDQAHVAAEYIE